MPACYVHRSVVLDAVAALSEKASSFAREAPLLCLGAQGPDVFFYYRILSPVGGRAVNETGEQMHRHRTGAMIRAILQDARSAGTKAQAWALGWIGHCAVDSVLHPYVYAYCALHAAPHRRSIEHMHLEQAMDAWLHREKDKERPLRQFDFFDQLKRDDLRQAADTLCRAASDVRPEAGITAPVACRAFEDMSRVLRLLYSPDGRRYRFFQFLEGVLGRPGLITCHAAPPTLPAEDFLNLSHRSWENPWHEGARTQSVPELMAAARELAVRWLDGAIGFFAGGKSLDEAASAIGDIDYRSGLPCGPESE